MTCFLRNAVALACMSFVLLSPSFAADVASTGKQYVVYPIGFVKKGGEKTFIVLDEKYQPGLLGLEDYSHMYVFYWFDRSDTPEQRAVLQIRPRTNPNNPLKGVFAARSPVRPNLIAMTLCRIVAIENNVIEVDGIDAFPDTPVIDIKPYVPNYDDAEGARVPDWIKQVTGTAAQ